MKRKALAIVGTRPETLKMEPVLEALHEQDFETEVLFTNQSPDLVEDLRSIDSTIFEMSGRWADLNDGIQRTMFEAQHRMRAFEPDCVLVQGDTASAFAGAVAAYLERVPVGHVEAGLRTYRENPRPEEAFRGAIASFTEWHFCPDRLSMENVAQELDYPGGIYETGNPIIDTLPSQPFRVLVTLHRRENWGEPIEDALAVLHDFASENDRVEIDVIEHPNWSEAVKCRPEPADDFFYCGPCSHDVFLNWMQMSDLVVTDSGGLQEEAAHFGIDCIVYREATERTALEAAGAVEVVDPTKDPYELRNALESRLRKREAYGDGRAGEKIADILDQEIPSNGENRTDEAVDSEQNRREKPDLMRELAEDNETFGSAPEMTTNYSLGN